MSDSNASSNDERMEERRDAAEPEDDELSIEELEEAAGGVGEYEPAAPQDECGEGPG